MAGLSREEGTRGMSQSEHLKALKDAITGMDLEGIQGVARAAMEAGVDPQAAITDGMVPGMVEVGRKFEAGEYYLSELVVAGEVMKDGMKVIEPYLAAGASNEAKAKAVIATVEGCPWTLSAPCHVPLANLHIRCRILSSDWCCCTPVYL